MKGGQELYSQEQERRAGEVRSEGRGLACGACMI